MSNETKREVFNELLKMFRNSMKLTHEEPVILDNDGYLDCIIKVTTQKM